MSSRAKAALRRLSGRSPFERRGHYYSPLLGPNDIQRRSDPHALVSGLTLNDDALWGNLEALAPGARSLALPYQRQNGRHYFSDNEWYGPGDAAVYYSMIRLLEPSRIVEAGSGFSTALALDAIADLETGITTIDPDPTRLRELGLLGSSALTVISTPVQDVPLDLFESLIPGDFLFLDTSHVAKTGSDVLWHIFHVLPRLRPGVLIHIHDIFPGFEYPLEWMEDGRSWNETYLLRAFLAFNSRFSVYLWPRLSWMRDPVRAEGLVPQLAVNPGGQIWLRVNEAAG